MARLGSTRSEHSTTYLTQEQLVRARRLTAVQKSKAQTQDITGEQVEELIADITGGLVTPGRTNRPVADIWINDQGYSVKTLALKPAKCRPQWHHWLGQEVTLPITRVKPLGDLPRGQSPADASPAVIGRRLIAGYNQMLETYGVERQAVLLRLRVEDEQLWRYYYWTQAVEPLDHAAYRWSDSDRSQNDGWSRNLRADLKGEKKGAAAITWTSQSRQLYLRHRIPADADTFVVTDSEILSREQATKAISQAIDQKLRG